MTSTRAGLVTGVALVLAAVVLAAPTGAAAGVVPGALVVRAAGRAPIREGRADLAFQQALEEAFRRGILEALQAVAPERQSPSDLEVWQETILTRAADFVAAWRVLSQGQQDPFLDVEAEIEVWRDKLARAARAAGGAPAGAAVRLLVLADAFPLSDPAAEEDVDAGRLAAVALETQLSRRGAVIVSTTDRAPWVVPSAPSSDESRVALAATAAKRLEADAVLLVRLARHAEGLTLSAQLIAVPSATTLGAGRAEVALRADAALEEVFLPAARQIAASLAPRLATGRPDRARTPLP